MKPLLFNFSHDLALARNCERYTPPPNVQMMERDLAGLAMYFPEGEVSYNPMAPVWGWDLSLVTRLKSQGYTALPSQQQIAEIRGLSSRKTAVDYLPLALDSMTGLPLEGKSLFCTDEEALDSAIGMGECIMKEPLSGSGRGLRFVRGEASVAQRNWALRCIREQGGVVVELLYDKVQDFALEFMSTESGVDYLGLSVFETNANNAYAGNRIAPQQKLWDRLNKFFPQAVFEALISGTKELLGRFFTGRYLGPLGVDMMIILKGGKLMIHPCVEINVRRTMGELSLHLQPLVSPEKEALFCLAFHKDPALLRQELSQFAPPAYDSQNRLISGVRILTPVKPETHYASLLKIL